MNANTKTMTPQERMRRKIWNILIALLMLPKVTVTSEDNLLNIYIGNSNQFIPDFWLQWCDYDYYRVYIMIVTTGDDNPEKEKRHVGYTICNISSSLVAAGFVGVYQFLFRNRGHNRG